MNKVKTTLDIILEESRKYLEKERFELSLYNTTVEALRKHEGHIITRRLYTTVKSELSMYSVAYDDSQWVGCKINIWGNGLHHGHFSVYLGDKGAEFGIEAYHEKNICYSQGCTDRIAEMEVFLSAPRDQERLARAIDNYREAKDSLQVCIDWDVPSMYAIREATNTVEL